MTQHDANLCIAMKWKQTQSSNFSKAAKRVLRSSTTLEIDIAEKEREMTIAVGLDSDGCSIRDAAKELGFHLKQCTGASLIANYFVIMLYFSAKRELMLVVLIWE